MSTVNIPENASNSDLVPIMKKREIEWLEHISSLSEFTSDSSWSVYNVRKDDTDIVPCINSILPLLRQIVATYSMQKHCNEVAKTPINALNPGQATVIQVTSPSVLFQDDCNKCFLTLLVLENINPCLVDSTLKNFF